MDSGNTVANSSILFDKKIVISLAVCMCTFPVHIFAIKYIGILLVYCHSPDMDYALYFFGLRIDKPRL